MNRSSLSSSGPSLFFNRLFWQTTPVTLKHLQACYRSTQRAGFATTTSQRKEPQNSPLSLARAEAAVACAPLKRIDEAREKLAGIQAQRKYSATEVKRHEDFISKHGESSTQRKEV